MSIFDYLPVSIHNMTEGGLTDEIENGKILKEVIEIVEPNDILELGFNAGHSATLWLEHSDADLVSVDIGRHYYTTDCAKAVSEKYGNRFLYIEIDSRTTYDNVRDTEFELIFIDASHEFNDVLIDLITGLRLNIPYFLMDDCFLNKNINAVYKAVQYFECFTVMKEYERGQVLFYNTMYDKFPFNKFDMTFNKQKAVEAVQ